MGNCLVTKLKGVVDNNNLLKLGEVRARTNDIVSNFYSSSLGIPDGVNEFVFEVLEGSALFYQDGGAKGVTRVVVSPGTGQVYLSEENPGNSVISLTSKYPIKHLNTSGVSWELDDFIHNGLVELYLTSSPATAKTLSEIVAAFPLLTKFGVYPHCKNVTGKISDLFPLKNQLTELCVNDNGQVEANFSDFAYFSLITDWSNANYNCVNITGTVESFAAVKRGLGVTTGSTTFRWLGSSGDVTFNNILVPNPGSSVDQVLSWTPTTITFNGETIQNSDIIH